MYCDVCHLDVKIANGGRTDIKRHVENQKHKQKACAKASTPSLQSFLQKVPGTDEDLDVSRPKDLCLYKILDRIII